MILECPACQNRYLVDPRAVGENGRMVRCAKCKHQWFAAPPTEEQTRKAETTLETEQKARAIPSGSSVPAVKLQKTSTPLALKLATIAMFLLLLISSAVYFQPLVVHSIPGTQRFYDLIGMYNAKGVVLAELAYSKAEHDLDDTHKLQGYIVNIANETQQVPVLQFSFFDKKGNLLKKRRLTEEGEMQAGEQREFERDMELSHGSADRIVIEIGNPIELGLR